MQLSRLRINLDIIKEKIIMAKQGFATSDRRKVELLPAVKPRGIEVHDCGTVFVLTSAAAAAHVLPSAAACGEGWWIRVVEGVDRGANAVTFAAASDAESGAAVIAGVAAGAVEGVTYTEPGGVPTVTFVANVSDVGDEVEILVANGQWFVRGVCDT